MKKKIGFIILVMVSALAWWRVVVWVFSVMDIPAPDVSDLVYDRPAVASEDNAYESLSELENEIDLSDMDYKAIRGFRRSCMQRGQISCVGKESFCRSS